MHKFSVGNLLALWGVTFLAFCQGGFAFDLILNGDFEEDDSNLRGEVMSCPVRLRVTFGQSDGLPDRWKFIGELNNSKTPQYLEKIGDAHSGKAALRLKPSNNFRLNQSFTCAIQTKEQADLAPLLFTCWFKGVGEKAALDVELVLQIREFDEKTKNLKWVKLHSTKKTFPATAKWSAVEFEVSSAELVQALKDKPQPVGTISGVLYLQASKDSESVVIDDIALVCEQEPASYTLVPNAGFESADRKGEPKKWATGRKSLRYFGSNYYVWRDWNHFLSVPRGRDRIDELFVHNGKRSLRMSAPPGDDRHIESPLIPLNQTEPRRMLIQFAYNSYLLANMLVQVVDDQGSEIFARNVVSGSTHGWRLFQAEFVPRRTGRKVGDVRTGGDLFGATGAGLPLKGCRIRIGVKGVNGSAMDDVNEWVNVNHSGVLWLDDVVLAEVKTTQNELKSRGVKTYTLNNKPPALAVESIDLGGRLYGLNEAAITIINHSNRKEIGTLTVAISGPYRENDPKKSGYAVGSTGQEKMEPMPGIIEQEGIAVKFNVQAGERVTVRIPYTIHHLLKDWRSEYRAGISLKKKSTEVAFGTWSQQVLVEVERTYAFPESKSQPVFMNIGVASGTLRKVERLRLNILRAKDDQLVATHEITDFQKQLKSFSSKPLEDGFQADATNFFLTNVSIEQLPIHSQTRPVRDHYIFVAGLSSNGQTIISGRSPRFGRMEEHNEKLDPIREVKIHKDNYLLINGKPFFSRGHIWMQQNFGPAPLARKNTEWKKYGFNNKAGVQSPFADAKNDSYGIGMQEVWRKTNTYIGSQMITAKGPMNDKIRAEIQNWISRPYIIGIHFIPWEGEPEGSSEESVRYAREIQKLIGTRPLWVSSGWYAPAVSGRIHPSVIENDWFMPENNSYFQPSQLDKEVLPIKQKRGEPCVLGTYPNVFNDTPYAVQRFEHWTEIIRHHTGYMQIGKPGDPTLMAGINGEFRFIETFLFSDRIPPEVSVAPKVEHLVRETGEATYIMATNAGPVIGGDWEWNAEIRNRGRASHTGAALWNRFHNYMRDTYSHFYKDDQPVMVEKGDRIVQYVFIPKGARVDHLILMARGNGEWRYHAVWGNFKHARFTDSGVRLWLAKDMHQMAWGSAGLGFCDPQGHEVKNANLLKYTFTPDQYHKLGEMPNVGTWAKLEVPVETVGLDGLVVDGFGFVSKGAKVWWEQTLLLRDGGERVLCDGSVGIPPDQLKKVRFNVAGLKAGTKIRVCFEERDIIASDGYFEDDFSGEPGYRNMWVGLYGDKIGETGYYGDGVFYNYNWGKVATRLYEISR